MVSLSDGTIVFVFSCSTDVPLEHFVRSFFLSGLLGQTVPGGVERKLFALPVQFGGLVIFDPSFVASQQHSCSVGSYMLVSLA